MYKQLHVMLDTQADADILSWLDAQASRSQAVKTALRRAMQPMVTLEGVRRVMREELRGWAPVSRAVGDVDAQLGQELDAMF